MKLGGVTKIDKRNTALSREIEDDLMSTNCNAIVFFSDLCQISLLLLKVLTFCKKTDISKVKEVLVLKGIFFANTCVSVLMCEISSFLHNSNEFYRSEV